MSEEGKGLCYNGQYYTMAGLNRWVGDFTVTAGFLLSMFLKSDFNPRWIRQPDSNDPPESIQGSQKNAPWYVLEERKGQLIHSNAIAIRPLDTIGMFPGGMTLVFDTRSEEDIKREAELLAELHPGCLAELEDDIIPGVSPGVSPSPDDESPR